MLICLLGSPLRYLVKSLSPLQRSLTASCWLGHCFEYTRESAGEERPLAFGIFNNRLDTTVHLTLYDHNNLCGGEW